MVYRDVQISFLRIRLSGAGTANTAGSWTDPIASIRRSLLQMNRTRWHDQDNLLEWQGFDYDLMRYCTISSMFKYLIL